MESCPSQPGDPLAADQRKSAALAREKVRVGRSTRVIGDYQAARELLRSGKVRQAGAGAGLIDTRNADEVGIFYLDGEEHRRKRATIAKYFTLRAIETRYRTIMERTSDCLLAAFMAEGRGCLDAIGFRLAVAVAAEIIGLDHSDLDGLAARVQATLTGPDDRVPVRPGDDPAVRDFFAIDVQPAIAARRDTRQEDVISRLIDDGWSDRAILTEVLGYSIAGMLTTRELIVMAAWYLFEQPVLLERFRNGGEGEQFAILEEILRLEPIVAVVARQVTEDIDTPACGHIPAGTLVAVDIRAANLDEAATGACPYKVRADRPDGTAAGTGYMSFGDGSHRCPGAQLALHEARLFLEKLLAVPGIRLESEPSLDWFRPVYSYELHNAVIACNRDASAAIGGN
jgi:cytochrome P450